MPGNLPPPPRPPQGFPFAGGLPPGHMGGPQGIPPHIRHVMPGGPFPPPAFEHQLETEAQVSIV